MCVSYGLLRVHLFVERLAFSPSQGRDTYTAERVARSVTNKIFYKKSVEVSLTLVIVIACVYSGNDDKDYIINFFGTNNYLC